MTMLAMMDDDGVPYMMYDCGNPKPLHPCNGLLSWASYATRVWSMIVMNVYQHLEMFSLTCSKSSTSSGLDEEIDRLLHEFHPQLIASEDHQVSARRMQRQSEFPSSHSRRPRISFKEPPCFL
eukprot:762486-Hanusia_phi.AAC.1